MTSLNETLDYLISKGYETETLEFKEAKNGYDFSKLGKYFSALSNEANLHGNKHAWLVFGVEDKTKSIVGSSFRKDLAYLHSLKKEIADKTTDRITFVEIHEVYTQGKRVVLFQIPAAPQGVPVAWQGHYYAREGESTCGLNIERLDRIRAQAINADWSAVICKEATLVDLDPAAIALARDLFASKNTSLAAELATWDDTTFLNKAKLFIKGSVTRAAILLLGRPEAEHYLSPGIARISWILRDRDGVEKDYEHFTCPFLLTADKVRQKIRMLKYRYFREGTLFPEEVDSYDPYIIREALNNCIAHQDYTLAGKINVVETEDSRLTFTNAGSFIPGSIEQVIQSDVPEDRYRNPFLSQAMVNLNMIDTIGSGIKKMFQIQRKKFFPLPEYSFDGNRVQVVVIGKVLDISYARKLAQMPELSLSDIMLLDKVQKRKKLEEAEIKHLRENALIEGRKPRFHISESVAHRTGQKVEYLRRRGVDDAFIRRMIIDYLEKFGEAKKSEFEEMLLDKISDALDKKQKKDKIKNILQSMKNDNTINSLGKKWRMSKLD